MLCSLRGQLTLLTFLFLSIHLSAQSAVSISSEEARQMVDENKDKVGFEKVYFSNQDLSRVLSMENCEAIRFYTAKPNAEDNAQTLIAVPVDGDGNELGNYLKADAAGALRMSAADAIQEVTNSKSSESSTLACSFDKNTINSLMAEGGDGLHLKPGKTREGSASLVSAPATVGEGGETEEVGSMQMLGAAPCPHACGGGSYLIQMN
jgi:hypothetical protein